ncbi:MAG: 30S ribosomal protein S16 [Melioribacteraceae bacterium]|nr:30S ribosomal protein S16 [Melioribacteraceae bacterium]
MAVKLRLRRMGKKRQPIYKLVAADSRSPRDGRFIESIGLYNPKTEPATVEIDEERALYWLGVGAQPTDTVKNLLSAEGILYKRSLMQKGMSEDEIANAMEELQSKREAKLVQAKSKAEKAVAEKEKAKAKEAEEKAKARSTEAKAKEEAETKKEAEAAEKTEENSDAAEETKEEEEKSE